MAQSTIRKAIGAVKDQTSIGIAKVSSNLAPELEVAVVKATSHDDDPASEKYVREILNLMSYSRGYVHACVSAVSKRLAKTRDWIVALKALVLVHRLMNEGPVLFQEEILYATRRGTRLLNMSDFRDEAHSSSWDHSAFVRTYAMYLDQRLELMLFDRKGGSVVGGSGSDSAAADRFVGRDNFRSPPPRAIEYEYGGEFREESGGYGNGNGMRRTRSFGDTSETVGKEDKRIVSVTPLRDMKPERIFGKMAKKPKSPERKKLEAPPVVKEEEPVPDMNEIKALPPPEDYTPPSPPKPEPEPEPKPQFTEDLVNLRDDADTADDQGNKFALALFAGGAANNGNGSWEAFPSNGHPEVTSAWHTPAAEPGKADWELALVETASNLSKQKATLGGGFDPLLLTGMYDQGIVRQHVSTVQLSGGSASSVALPGPGKTITPVLALPAPDGTVKAVNQDPFAASLSIPPPSYVQMSDMEKKQQLLAQEQQLWQHYARDGMQGQASLIKLSGPGYYVGGPMPVMPYGMPSVNGMGPPTGYYHSPY
ncbi:putative ANTH domain-containing protein [Lupinus albus]|uniref:Putative ANTH domain-containing protein n=1 Tax=Lupinus albus TaxID=3870 RepID=A0A6A4NAJ9_LUPAL|nr:putative ANTH domain-containing protein [Lupinus albus]